MNKLKIMIGICLLLVSNAGIAQNKNICGEVYYTQVTNLSSVYTEKYLMTFNNEESYAEEINIKSSKDGEAKNNSDEGVTTNFISGRKNLTSKYMYKSKVGFYFRDNFFDEILLVKEDAYTWKWNLQQEKKKIGVFSCQKATTTFRGRNYIAWFTNEIPVPFGPWKFQGLSGLILEVYDTDNLFHIIADKVTIGDKLDCRISLDKNQLRKSISISAYLEKKEELLDAEFLKIASRMPKGFKTPKRDKNCDDCGGEIEKF